MTGKSIAVIVAAYNEEGCIDELCRRIRIVFDQLSTYDFKAIIVENGSTDGTLEKLLWQNSVDGRFQIIETSRNFRMDGGITAGLAYADTDAVVFMTADLQDPPELIPAMIAEWEAGFDNIYGIVKSRKSSGLIRRINSSIFYWLIGKLTGQLIPKNVSDFRLLDRKVYEQIRSMEERNRFVRGLVAWVGFKSVGIEFEREERYAGESKAASLKVISLATRAIFSHSQIPLLIIPIIGFVFFVGSMISLVFFLVDWLTLGVPFPGFGTIVSIFIFMFGLLFLFLGIFSLYIGLIYDEVKGRPNFVVKKTYGVTE